MSYIEVGKENSTSIHLYYEDHGSGQSRHIYRIGFVHDHIACSASSHAQGHLRRSAEWISGRNAGSTPGCSAHRLSR